MNVGKATESMLNGKEGYTTAITGAYSEDSGRVIVSMASTQANNFQRTVECLEIATSIIRKTKEFAAELGLCGDEFWKALREEVEDVPDSLTRETGRKVF